MYDHESNTRSRFGQEFAMRRGDFLSESLRTNLNGGINR